MFVAKILKVGNSSNPDDAHNLSVCMVPFPLWALMNYRTSFASGFWQLPDIEVVVCRPFAQICGLPSFWSRKLVGEPGTNNNGCLLICQLGQLLPHQRADPRSLPPSFLRRRQLKFDHPWSTFCLPFPSSCCNTLQAESSAAKSCWKSSIVLMGFDSILLTIADFFPYHSFSYFNSHCGRANFLFACCRGFVFFDGLRHQGVWHQLCVFVSCMGFGFLIRYSARSSAPLILVRTQLQGMNLMNSFSQPPLKSSDLAP